MLFCDFAVYGGAGYLPSVPSGGTACSHPGDILETQGSQRLLPA